MPLEPTGHSQCPFTGDKFWNNNTAALGVEPKDGFTRARTKRSESCWRDFTLTILRLSSIRTAFSCCPTFPLVSGYSTRDKPFLIQEARLHDQESMALWWQVSANTPEHMGTYGCKQLFYDISPPASGIVDTTECGYSTHVLCQKHSVHDWIAIWLHP